MARASDSKDKTAQDEALSWFVRINSGDATEAEKADHAAWMAKDPGNRAEYAKLGDIWSYLDRIPDPRVSTKRPASRIPNAAISRRALLAGGSAAALSAAGVVAICRPDFLTSDYATAAGELRSVTLPDGSLVELDSDTAIALAFTDEARVVKLLRGRVYFDVARDRSRPFTVLAEDGSTTALGTRFVVHEWAGTVTVSVEESAVSVVAPDRLQKVVVKAGENVSYNTASLGEVRSADVASETAWRRGKLVFEDRPLRQVLADVNRYRSGFIRVTDSRLFDMRVSGVFDISNPDGILDAIGSALPIRVTRMTRYLVILQPV